MKVKETDDEEDYQYEEDEYIGNLEIITIVKRFIKYPLLLNLPCKSWVFNMPMSKGVIAVV